MPSIRQETRARPRNRHRQLPGDLAVAHALGYPVVLSIMLLRGNADCRPRAAELPMGQRSNPTSSPVFVVTEKRDEVSLSNILVADCLPVTKSGFGLINFG